MKVLIIEDSAEVRDMLFRTLCHKGYEVTASGDCGAAIKAFESEYFDLVVTDLAMPEMDGFECAKELRKVRPDVTIAAYTAYPAAVNRAAKGIDAYFLKSRDEEKLLAWVEGLTLKATA